MAEIFQHLKTAFQDNFVSAMFLLVVGTIAFAFIGYLLFDYFRMQWTIFRTKRRHRRDARNHMHRHS
jgi:hypothetical protein